MTSYQFQHICTVVFVFLKKSILKNYKNLLDSFIAISLHFATESGFSEWNTLIAAWTPVSTWVPIKYQKFFLLWNLKTFINKYLKQQLQMNHVQEFLKSSNLQWNLHAI